MSILDISPPAFIEHAACVDEPPELFFPLSGGDPGTDAKKVCAPCPVRVNCLAYALEMETATSTRWGVWGGLSAVERDQLQRRRK